MIHYKSPCGKKPKSSFSLLKSEIASPSEKARFVATRREGERRDPETSSK
jgi:hypothetical protein